jgi:hypothetical protein
VCYNTYIINEREVKSMILEITKSVNFDLDKVAVALLDNLTTEDLAEAIWTTNESDDEVTEEEVLNLLTEMTYGKNAREKILISQLWDNVYEAIKRIIFDYER